MASVTSVASVTLLSETLLGASMVPAAADREPSRRTVG